MKEGKGRGHKIEAGQRAQQSKAGQRAQVEGNSREHKRAHRLTQRAISSSRA